MRCTTAGWPLVGLVSGLVALSGCTSGEPGRPPPPLPGLGVASNGEDRKPPREVLDNARGALLDGDGVHAVGALLLAGRAVQVDLLITADGGVNGTVRDGAARVQVVRSGSEVLVRGDPALATFLGVAPAAAQAGAADDLYRRAVASPVDSLALPALADRLLRPGGEPEPLRTGDVDGSPAVVVSVGASRIWVAATGPPLPLRVAGGPDVPGVLALADQLALPSPATLPSGSIATATDPTATAPPPTPTTRETP